MVQEFRDGLADCSWLGFLIKCPSRCPLGLHSSQGLTSTGGSASNIVPWHVPVDGRSPHFCLMRLFPRASVSSGHGGYIPPEWPKRTKWEPQCSSGPSRRSHHSHFCKPYRLHRPALGNVGEGEHQAARITGGGLLFHRHLRTLRSLTVIWCLLSWTLFSAYKYL